MIRIGMFYSALVLLASAGCVEQVMTIRSDPPGALVSLNGQEVGRTPMTRDFVWYSNYDVTLRKEGYQTLKTSAKVYAPIWQWIPLDLVFEILPVRLRDTHELAFALKPEALSESEPAAILARAEQAKALLRSSDHTRRPAARAGAGAGATTRPAAP